jgi:VanZ family protein
MSNLGISISRNWKTVLKPLSFLPAILIMCMIFSFSAQNDTESGQLSYQVGMTVFSVANNTFDRGWSQTELEELTNRSQHLIRKTAHVTEYVMLAVSVAFPLYVYGVKGLWLVLMAGSFCVVFAGLDEFHQSFVDGRSPQTTDVLIDSCGVMIGLVIATILGWTGQMTMFRTMLDNKFNKNNRKQLTST